MIKYAIKNEEGKYLLLDSRFIIWNDMPNVQFFETEGNAQQVIDHFHKQESMSDDSYNPLKGSDPLKICCFDIHWNELPKFMRLET